MEESLTAGEVWDEDRINHMYMKVVAESNQCNHKHGFIRCPECGEEILMIPTLRTMNEAIENHVKIHKDVLRANPPLKQITAIHIRIDLAQQVLEEASNPLRLF